MVAIIIRVASAVWLAGGGVKPGIVYGETDDFSYNVVDKPVHIHDLNATILHCLGIDHSRFAYRFQGLDVRLTGVEEQHPVHEILLIRGTAAYERCDRSDAVSKFVAGVD